MADDDWFTSLDEEPAEETPVAPGPGATPSEKGAAAEQKTEAAEDQEDEQPPAESAEDEYLDPDKLLLFKHWIRPKFLQYKYLYEYRHNYYNDVIDYLDKKRRGVKSEIPRPQTWAERVLRTSKDKLDILEIYKRETEEKLKNLMQKRKMTHHSSFATYHSKEYMSRRYTSVI